jgi:hypothetical protein
MNYSLFIMVLKEMVSIELKGQLGASPLISSQSSDPYGVFRVSPPPPRKIAKEGDI